LFRIEISFAGHPTPKVCYLPFQSNENKRKKSFDPGIASSLVKTFWVMHNIVVQNLRGTFVENVKSLESTHHIVLYCTVHGTVQFTLKTAEFHNNCVTK
jgi:hypothetical protein